MSERPIRVLVCGGRTFADHDLLYATLWRVHKERPFAVLLHGDASGADRQAGTWAQRARVQVEAFPADWAKHGRAAGPIRNAQMLRDGKPDLVIAFPGGSGTAHMVKIAKAAGIEVKEVRK